MPALRLACWLRASPSTLGIPGFLLLNAPDVCTALHSLVQNLDLHDQGGVPILDSQGNSTLFGYAIHQAGAEATEHIYDLSIAVACNIMRSMCGRGWNPTEVHLTRRAPADPGTYRQFYRTPLRFEMDRNAIVFPSRWMNHKIPSADALLHRHMEREANELHALRQADIVNDARRKPDFLEFRCLNPIATGRLANLRVIKVHLHSAILTEIPG